VALKKKANIHFSMKTGMRIMNWVQVFLYIRESVERVEFVSDDVVQNTKRSLV
jgi:hypothetical protein